MKQVLIRMAACGLACFLCACGGQKEGPNVTLKTVSMFGEGDSAGPAYQELLEGFQREHPGVIASDASEVSSEEWKRGVLEAFGQKDAAPDVLFFFNGAAAREIILNNQVVPVEEIRETYPDYASNIRASTMNLMKEFDGNHYAVPVKGFWEGLFCNLDVFERCGAPLPKDWESLEAAIKIFREKGVVPIAASLKEVPHYWIEHLILSQGGEIEHRLNPKGYVPASWSQGIARFQTLYDMGAFPPDTMESDNAAETALFLDKKAAMILDGSWLVQSITDMEHTSVYPFPVAPGGRMKYGDIISGYSSGFYITRKAWEEPAKREAAVSFVRYMTSAESMAAMCAMGGAPAMDIEQTGTDSLLQRSANELQQNAPAACMPIDSKLYKEAWQYLCGQIPAVAQGERAARSVMEEVSRRNRW